MNDGRLMSTSDLRTAVDNGLAGSGFRRKGQSWFLDGPDVVVVVNVQRSRADSLHFLNLAFWLKAVAPPPAMPPSESKCHMRIRATSAFPERASDFDALLDTDSPAEGRNVCLAELLEGTVVPFVLAGATEAGLRRLFQEGRFARGLVDQRCLPVVAAT